MWGKKIKDVQSQSIWETKHENINYAKQEHQMVIWWPQKKGGCDKKWGEQNKKGVGGGGRDREAHYELWSGY